MPDYGFQYPTLRIVLCNLYDQSGRVVGGRTFSILPYGSFSATLKRELYFRDGGDPFSILPYGSFSATAPLRGAYYSGSSLSVSYPTDRSLQQRWLSLTRSAHRTFSILPYGSFSATFRWYPKAAPSK